MSRKSNYFIVYNVRGGYNVTAYGRNTVAQLLRENDCKFDDKKLNLVQGENAIVFNSKTGNSFIVEEAFEVDE